MPLLLVGLAGLGFGSFFGGQVDDVIDNVNGERDGVPWLLLAGVAIAFMYFKFGRK